MDNVSKPYEITVYVMGSGHRGVRTVIREVTLSFYDLYSAAKNFSRICHHNGGVSQKCSGKATYYPHHSIVRVETDEAIHDRAVQMEQERIPELVVEKVKDELGDVAGGEHA